VDVFTDQIFGGNQLAVFKDSENLSTDEMQNIAKELNLSEITFVTDIGINYKKLRIFTPKIELPMAGHPTIGTAFVLADECAIETSEGINRLVFQEGVGEIEVSIEIKNAKIRLVEMAQPMPTFGPIFDDIQKISELLSINITDIDTDYPIQTVSTGVPFLYVPIKTLGAIKKIKMRLYKWEEHFCENDGTKNIFTFTKQTLNACSTVHSRMFAPAMGIAEDSATGGASGPLGAYLVEYGIATQNKDGKYNIISEQGLEMGRPSFINITIGKTGNDFSEIKIGGNCVKTGMGLIYIPTL
jgi:trans-2,3-dihydro-3-hydroxyanthranilate isomerase